MFHEFRPRPLEKNGQQDGRESGQEGEKRENREREREEFGTRNECGASRVCVERDSLRACMIVL